MQKEIKRKMNNGKEFRSNNDGWRQFTCQPLDCQSTRRRQANSDRSRISVFTKQNTNKQNGTWERYSRTTEENESKRLISIAKENNLYIDNDILQDSKRTKKIITHIKNWLKKTFLIK